MILDGNLNKRGAPENEDIDQGFCGQHKIE
jgi:hypothetical protein